MSGNAFSAGLRSWKTTALGIIGGLVVLLNSAAAFIDDDPNTVLDMNVVTEAIVGIVMILWGVTSRDADKSSQDSGIRNHGRGVLLFVALSAAAPSMAMADDQCVQFGVEVSAPVESAPEAAMPEPEVSPVASDFRSNFLVAVREARKDGKINLRQAIRLRVASLSPAFMERAQELAVTQIALSGEESEYVPRGPDGAIDANGIDWSGLLAFLEALLPILLQIFSLF